MGVLVPAPTASYFFEQNIRGEQMKNLQQILTAALICFGFTGMAVAGASTPANLTIMDDPSYNVHSDGKGLVLPNLYIDRNLPNGDPCDSGGVNSTGYTVFYPGTKLSNGLFCNAGLPANEQRTYVFLFPYGDGDVGGYPGPCQYLHVPQGPTGYCTVTTDPLDYERIILGSPFAPKPSTGQMHLALSLNHVRYGVITDTSGSVTSLDANTRVITYTRTAKLFLVVSGTASQQLTYSFQLPFQMQVQRVP